MDDALPEGYLDPYDAAAVAALLARTQAVAGREGVLDLLGRLPGAVTDPGRGGGLFRSATPPTIRLGGEWIVVVAEPPVLEHVVSGVVLQREALPAGRVASALAPVVVDLTRDLGTRLDTALVLTAYAETLERG